MGNQNCNTIVYRGLVQKREFLGTIWHSPETLLYSFSPTVMTCFANLQHSVKLKCSHVKDSLVMSKCECRQEVLHCTKTWALQKTRQAVYDIAQKSTDLQPRNFLHSCLASGLQECNLVYFLFCGLTLCSDACMLPYMSTCSVGFVPDEQG